MPNKVKSVLLRSNNFFDFNTLKEEENIQFSQKKKKYLQNIDFFLLFFSKFQ